MTLTLPIITMDNIVTAEGCACVYYLLTYSAYRNSEFQSGF